MTDLRTNPAMHRSIDDILPLSYELNNIIEEKLSRAYSGLSVRSCFALIYASIASEHHSAICRLVQEQHYASALAMMRPLVDTAYRGLWLQCCIPDAKLKRFLKAEDVFPGFKKLAAEVDAAYPGKNGVFSAAVRMYRWFSDHNHTGLAQAAGRFHPQTGIGPTYKTEHIISLLSLSSQTMAMFATTLLEALDLRQAAEDIMRLQISQLEHARAREAERKYP